jgi:DNA-binding GntR family transcriptional regulator
MERIEASSNLQSQVAEQLRQAIISGELAPGKLYSVIQIAKELGVSRTPAREALLTLANSGLIEVQKNRGFIVIKSDAKRIHDVFSVRILLEVPAAADTARSANADVLTRLSLELESMRAAARIGDATIFMRHDRLFHGLFLQVSDNQVLMGIVTALRDTISDMGETTASRSRSLEEIAHEHDPILIACQAHDADAAAAAMSAHLRRTRDLLVAQTEAPIGSGTEN